MQFHFLRTITPVEILVGAKRWRALQLVIVDVELVGFEPRAVAQPAPRQWKQVGSHAEEAAETEHRVGYFPGNLVDHQTFDLTDHVPVGSPHRGALDAIAGD